MKKRENMKVGKHTIGGDNPCFIIAEIGNNHNGDMDRAKHLVDEAVKAGASAVKFQLRSMVELYGSDFKERRSAADLGTQYTLDLLERFNFTVEQMAEIFEYSEKKGILAFATPWDLKSVDDLVALDSLLFKVASADMTNHQLLRHIAATGRPLICSTGMSKHEEIGETLKVLQSCGASFALLHCNSTYPAPFKDINLAYMKKIQDICPIVGYSGHERGFHVPLAAVALGAKIIEKHFTLDRRMEGVDHRVSLLPAEFADMVRCIREVEDALGREAYVRQMSQGEMMNRENLGKSVVAKAVIEAGTIITKEMLAIRSPGQGLQPNLMDRIVGVTAKRRLDAGDLFFNSDLPGQGKVEFRPYQFSRKWGVPVRYHDLNKFLRISQPDFVEFHLSYGDMEENLSRFFAGSSFDIGYTVHAPELFANDHIVDLCSDDDDYLRTSIESMRRVVDITRELNSYFPKQRRPFIIATIGGFTTDRPLTGSERRIRYLKIIENLRKIQHPDVEILPQSTAPFPWHMGGQQYQNLFLYPDEIKWFCEEFGYRICLDVSHSFLACNHLGFKPEEFFEMVAPYTAHLHLGDCRGVDGEGLQIGEGDIDFKKLGGIFAKHCPEATFIPEIWQGHKNDGEAFWIACERLERII
jgi:N-acetylneuraminate synthase